MAVKKDTNIDIINSARAFAVQYDIGYDERIPVATQENIENIYETFLGNQGARPRTALVSALYDLVGLQTVRYDGFENPLAVLKSPDMPWGGVEQEIYTNFAKGKLYNPLAGVDEAFRIYRSHTMLAEHRINFEMQYPVTITRDDLKRAFLSNTGLNDLIMSKRRSIVSGYKWDEYLTSKRLVKSADDSGVLYRHVITDYESEDEIKELLVQLEATAQHMAFPQPELTVAGATSSLQSNSDLILMTTPEVSARIKVLAQAYAFNYGFLTNEANQIIIDKFDNPDHIAFLCDRRWFDIRNHFFEYSWQDNGASLNRNEFLTVSEMFSYSPFMQAKLFTKAAQDTTGISIEATTVQKGTQTVIPVTFTGTNPLKTYEMKVVGNSSIKTLIVPGTNLLIVGDDETSAQLTVMVETLERSDTNSDLPKFTSQATVTIEGNAVIISVAVTPDTATVAAGATQQFTASVGGVGTVDQTVIWTVVGNGTIDQTGLLTVNSGTTSGSTVQVLATSAQDSTKSGYATVTVE